MRTAYMLSDVTWSTISYTLAVSRDRARQELAKCCCHPVHQEGIVYWQKKIDDIDAALVEITQR